MKEIVFLILIIVSVYNVLIGISDTFIENVSKCAGAVSITLLLEGTLGLFFVFYAIHKKWIL